ncbi:MAG: methyltransferase domain-containing protein [Chloroflexota bacterium]
MNKTLDHFPAEYFKKQDPGSDTLFYQFPRMVAHIDDSAITYLRDTVYADLLPANGTYLDMMSSRYSHYPQGLTPERVYGHGMNAAEMEANPLLDEFVVQNLNDNPTLPHAENTFDAVTNCVSVQYLQQPLEVFTSVLRVLRPDAPFIVSFSNRCFPTKAMRVWLNSSDEEHVQLVTRYMELAGFTNIETRRKPGKPGFFGMGEDPLYAVIGRKPARA